MSGPRVTSGTDSQQDYGTPADFLKSVVERFGPIQFDLAAHKSNKKHERYFAPREFLVKYDPDKKFDLPAAISSLVRQGALDEEARAIVASEMAKGLKTEIWVPNRDSEAYALGAFFHSWADLSLKFHTGSNPGILWLNCEFDDIEPWARRCRFEAEKGANILLLTPASVGSNWYRDLVAGHADVYELNGRLSFDGKNAYPKDCMLSHFYNGATLNKHVWEWRKNKIWHSWSTTKNFA